MLPGLSTVAAGQNFGEWGNSGQFIDVSAELRTRDVITAYVVLSSTMSASLGDLGHYAGPATLILSSLADGPKHGYALMLDIGVFAGVQLQPGTLYGAIRTSRTTRPHPTFRRGRPSAAYRMTAHGAAVLQDHLKAQQRVSEVGLHRLSIGWTIA